MYVCGVVWCSVRRRGGEDWWRNLVFQSGTVSHSSDKATPWSLRLMAMLCDVHDHCLLPAEEKVPCAGPCGYRDAQVPVVGHEDEHEEVADDHLDDMQHCLQEVRKLSICCPTVLCVSIRIVPFGPGTGMELYRMLTCDLRRRPSRAILSPS